MTGRGVKRDGAGQRPTIQLKRLAHAEGLPLPAYQTPGASGFDIACALAPGKPLTIAPRRHVSVPTGLILEIPEGYEVQLRPRSGLAARHGLTVLNAPGTIDSDYRGEVMVLLVNLGARAVTLQRGDRIAQAIVAPIVRADLVAAEIVSKTMRGAGGFGSTGRGASKSSTRKRAKGGQ